MKSRKKDFTPKEIDFVKDLLKGTFYLIPHSKEKLESRKITMQQVAETVAYGELIEAHNLADSLRILLRKPFDSKDLCVVISLCNQEIITAYWNAADDHHKTLNAGMYQLTEDIRDLYVAQ
jgi:hypothetical protein